MNRQQTKTEVEKLREERDELERAVQLLICDTQFLREQLQKYKDANYVLVPRIPTQKMITAGKHTLKGAADELFESIVAECVYKQMIAAVEQSK